MVVNQIQISFRSAFIIPVKIMMFVAFFDVPPHMCTFTGHGCFALCLSSLGIQCLRKHKRLWCSSWMVDSSVKITSLKSSLALNRSLHQINLFLLSYRKVNITCIIHMSINLCNLHQESAGSNVALCTPTLIFDEFV